MAFNSIRRFEPFENRVWLASPTMHGEEIDFIMEAYRTNWMSTVGKNIDEVEKLFCNKIGCDYAVALSSGTAALHMAVRLAGIDIYGNPELGQGALAGKRVFVADMTFNATVGPILYEGGVPIFIDSETDTWNMDPEMLEAAFRLYPEVKLVIIVHLYGTPGKIDEIKSICDKHGAILIEDAAEALGATFKGTQIGTFGKYNCISFNGNKIITGSAGGMLLTNNMNAANKAHKWSTQARESAPWYQHNEIGYNYRMSNVIAGVIRGQFPYLDEHIAQKKEIYNRYLEGLKEIPVKMNPYDSNKSQPNFWLSCMTINRDAMCKHVRSENETTYKKEKGKSCPTEILEALESINAESRPIWKPMHLQPIYSNQVFISKDSINMGINSNNRIDVGSDIFNRGVCLPSDIKMTEKQQRVIISVIKDCFK